MTSCLDEASLLAFGRGEVPPPKRAEIESHVAGCEECRVLVSAVRRASLIDSAELAGDVPAAPEPGPAIDPGHRASLAPVQPASSRGRLILVAACALVFLALALKLASGQ